MATTGPIPSFTPQGVLPPYVGSPTNGAGFAPYHVSLLEFAQHFATSKPRVAILQGFMQHRGRLIAAGVRGFQWIDGSFVEDIEKTESRSPRDVDVVTFHGRPPHLSDPLAWNTFVNANMELFDPAQSKTTFHVDAQYVDFGFGPVATVRATSFWYGLFSHKRVVGLWKGLIEVPMDGLQDGDVNNLLSAF